MFVQGDYVMMILRLYDAKRATSRLPRLAMAILALVQLMSDAARADSLVVGPYEIHCLEQNEIYSTVTILPYGKVCTKQYTLTITGSGGLDCYAAAILDIETDGEVILSGGGTHDVDGLINLYPGSTLSITSANSTFAGSGQLVGGSDSAVVSIARDVKLVITANHIEIFNIEGELKIVGDGEFRNDARVVANASMGGVLHLQVATITGAGRWEASGAGNPILRFDVDTSSLTGCFMLSNGAWFQFYNDADVVTTSSFIGNCGKVDVDGGGSFTYGSQPTTVSVDTNYGGYPFCS